jgi:alanine dehydrogenase
MALLLTETDVRAILTMPLALEAVEDSFRRLASGSAIVYPRHRLHLPGQSYLHYMAAADGSSGYAGLKMYTSSREGLRFLVPLFSVQSGDLLAMIEADYLGQMRTGAASGVATRWMAREDAHTLAMIGTGSQARTQLEAIALVRKIESVRAFGRDAGRREKFAKEMTERLHIPVTPVATAEAALRGAAIVVTSTTASQPVVEARWLEPGMHINAIGANFPQKQELDAAAVGRCDLVVVDSLEQSKHEAGDLIQAYGEDAARWSGVHELSEIAGGKMKGRIDARQITLFKSNGIASEDIVVAGRIYELAHARGLGQEIPLWKKDARAAEGRGLS